MREFYLQNMIYKYIYIYIWKNDEDGSKTSKEKD